MSTDVEALARDWSVKKTAELIHKDPAPQRLRLTREQEVFDFAFAEEAFLAGYKAAHAWRPINENPHMEGKPYLLLHEDGFVCIGELHVSEGDKDAMWMSEYTEVKPTHWLPLPSIPEEKAE